MQPIYITAKTAAKWLGLEYYTFLARLRRRGQKYISHEKFGRTIMVNARDVKKHASRSHMGETAR